MMRRPPRDEILAAKADQIQRELEEWAQRTAVIGLGEILVFSLQVKQGSTFVQRDPNDALELLRPFTISHQCREKYAGTFVRPAELSLEEINELLGLLPAGRVFETLRNLLVDNGNVPMHCVYSDVKWRANKALGGRPIGGKHLRIAVGKDAQNGYAIQLWEVQPHSSMSRP